MLTGLAMLISAIGGLLVALHTIDILPLEKPTREPVQPIQEPRSEDIYHQLLEVLRRNAQGWNTHDVDLVMSTWHEHASRIMTGGNERNIQSWKEYRSGLLPRIQYQYRNVRYIECANIEYKGSRANLDCIAKMDSRDRPGGYWKPDSVPMHFEFIKSNGKWYLWSQSY